jgi:hypothetical protein
VGSANPHPPHEKQYLRRLKSLHNVADGTDKEGRSNDMCNIYERFERLGRTGTGIDVDRFERTNPLDEDCREPDESRLVQKYKRSSADHAFVYEKVRTPVALEVRRGHEFFWGKKPNLHAANALSTSHPLHPCFSGLAMFQRTTLYLLSEVCCMPVVEKDRHGFIIDRLRGIRHDFALQKIKSTRDNRDFQRYIDVLEMSTRYFIHEIYTLDEWGEFDQQFQNIFLDLCDAYLQAHRRRIPVPNIAEFSSYMVIYLKAESSILEKLEKIPEYAAAAQSDEVLLAYSAMAGLKSMNAQPYVRFLKVATYLQSCVLTKHLNLARSCILSNLHQSVREGSQNTRTLPELTRSLLFDNDTATAQFLESWPSMKIEPPDDVRIMRLKTNGENCLLVPQNSSFHQLGPPNRRF